MGRLSATLTQHCLDLTGFSGTVVKVRLENDMTLGISIASTIIKKYIELVEEGFHVAGILYEDIIADPKYAFSQVLKYVELPESLAELGVKGLEQDSQRNSPFGVDCLAQVATPVMTQKTKEMTNCLLRRLGIPVIGEDPWLPGTITRRFYNLNNFCSQKAIIDHNPKSYI